MHGIHLGQYRNIQGCVATRETRLPACLPLDPLRLNPAPNQPRDLRAAQCRDLCQKSFDYALLPLLQAGRISASSILLRSARTRILGRLRTNSDVDGSSQILPSRPASVVPGCSCGWSFIRSIRHSRFRLISRWNPNPLSGSSRLESGPPFRLIMHWTILALVFRRRTSYYV